MKSLLQLLLVAVLAWYTLTTVIYAFSHPEKTGVQVFLHTPKTLLLDFED